MSKMFRIKLTKPGVKFKEEEVDDKLDVREEEKNMLTYCLMAEFESNSIEKTILVQELFKELKSLTDEEYFSPLDQEACNILKNGFNKTNGKGRPKVWLFMLDFTKQILKPEEFKVPEPSEKEDCVDEVEL